MNKEKPKKDAQADGTLHRASRKHFSDLEFTALDSVNVSSNANPQREVLEGAAKAITICGKKVRLVECMFLGTYKNKKQ